VNASSASASVSLNLAGARSLLTFRDTELVNSIGVSILVGVIDAAEQNTARLIFSDVNNHTAELFQMLGLTRHVSLASNEDEAPLVSIRSPFGVRRLVARFLKR
jgi:anti-anti-sigma regulatory factor